MDERLPCQHWYFVHNHVAKNVNIALILIHRSACTIIYSLNDLYFRNIAVFSARYSRAGYCIITSNLMWCTFTAAKMINGGRMKLEEIARLAGVSRTTASYVVNGKAEQHRISVTTRERVMAVVNQYNYKPDQAATALRLGSSRLFGFILPDLENTSYARLAKLLEAGAREHGFQLIITCSDDNPDTEKSLAEMLTSRRIDALLVSTVLDPYNDFYPRLQQKGLPVIAIDRALDDEKFASVISEDLDGKHHFASFRIEF